MAEFRGMVSQFEAAFFRAVAESSAGGEQQWVRLHNGDVLFGFSDWRHTYYRPIFEQCAAEIAALNISEHAYGAFFDAMISYHCENSLPLLKTLYMRPGAVVIDVGVRGGHWAVKAARAAEVVVAIDPTATAEDFSRLHIERNSLRNVRFVRAATDEQDGAERLFYSGSPGESYSGFLRETRDANGGLVVKREHHKQAEPLRTRRIDSIVDELCLPRVDLIVLQINGAERLALKGASETLAKWHPLLHVTSYHSDSGGGDIESIAKMLADWGYRRAAEADSYCVFA